MIAPQKMIIIWLAGFDMAAPHPACIALAMEREQSSGLRVVDEDDIVLFRQRIGVRARGRLVQMLFFCGESSVRALEDLLRYLEERSVAGDDLPVRD